MEARHFADHLRERGSTPMCRIPDEDLAALAKDAQASADWLQSQAAEMQRLAARCRKEQRRRKRGRGEGAVQVKGEGAPHIAAMDDPRPAAAAAWNKRAALLTAPPGYVLVPLEDPDRDR